MAQGGVSAAARGGDHGRGEAGRVGHDDQRHRHGRGRQGRDTSAPIFPGIVEQISFESGRHGAAKATCWCGSTRGRSARSSPPPRRSASSRVEPRARHAVCCKQQIVAQADYDQRRPRSSRPRRGSGRSAPPSSARRSARPFSGVLGIRQVNLGQYLAGGAPIVSLQASAAGLRELHRAAAGGEPPARRRRRSSVTSDGFEGTEVGQDHRRRFGRRRGHAQHPGPGHLRQRGRQAAPRHVRRGAGRPRRAAAGRHAPGLGDQLRAVRRFGLHRRGREGPGRQDLPRRAPAVREARRLARRPGGGRSPASSRARRS